jgi:4-amino-4-deoxychorismate lyase
MAASAARLDLALPPAPALAELAAQACAGWPAEREGALRLVCTRGPESGTGPVTVFATLAGVEEVTRRARQVGIAVRTATLGLPADVRGTAPWLLGGAKTVSYAVNMASQRWARSVGVDDVLWVSTEGYALEAPTSTLVWREGSALCTVPVEQTGILAGITTRWLLDHADALGCTAGGRMITPAELTSVDGVWFLSSVRGVAALRELDGEPTRTRRDETDGLRKLLGYP